MTALFSVDVPVAGSLYCACWFNNIQAFRDTRYGMEPLLMLLVICKFPTMKRQHV